MNPQNLKFDFPNYSKPSSPKDGYKIESKIASVDVGLSKKYESRYNSLFRAKNIENFRQRLGWIFENEQSENFRNPLIEKSKKTVQICEAIFGFCDLVVSSSSSLRKDLDRYEHLNDDQRTDIFARLLNTKAVLPKGKVVTIDQFVNLYTKASGGINLGIDKADIAAACVCEDFNDFKDLRLQILSKRASTGQQPLNTHPKTTQSQTKQPPRSIPNPKPSVAKSSEPKLQNKKEAKANGFWKWLIGGGIVAGLTVLTASAVHPKFVEYCKEVKSGNFRTETVQTQKLEVKTELTPQYKIITSILPDELTFTIDSKLRHLPNTGKTRTFYTQEGLKKDIFTYEMLWSPNKYMDKKGNEYYVAKADGNDVIIASQMSTSRDYSVVFEMNGYDEFITTAPFNDLNKSIEFFNSQGFEVISVLGASPIRKMYQNESGQDFVKDGFVSQVYSYINFSNVVEGGRIFEFDKSVYQSDNGLKEGTYVTHINGKFVNNYISFKDFDLYQIKQKLENLKADPDVVSISINSWPMSKDARPEPQIGQARAANIYKNGKHIAVMFTPAVSYQDVLKLAQKQYGNDIEVGQMDGDFYANMFVLNQHPGNEYNQSQAATLMMPQLLVRNKKEIKNQSKIDLYTMENESKKRNISDKFCDLRDSNKVKDKTRGFFKF